ncbi:MAG: caspase family protein [Bacteroidota bacterium]
MKKLNYLGILISFISLCSLQIKANPWTESQSESLKLEAKTIAVLLKGYSEGLDYTGKDIKSMKTLLKKDYFGSVDEIEEFIGQNNRVKDFKNYLKSLDKRLSKGDKLIIFYAGHGSELGNNDTELLLSQNEAISMSFLVSTLEKLAKKKIKSLLIVDACASGLYFDKNKVKARAEIIYIMSSTSSQVAIENKRIKNGLLTQFLSDAVKGEANIGRVTKENREITVTEVEKFLKKRMEKFIKKQYGKKAKYFQIPVIVGKGDELLATSKIPVRPQKGLWFWSDKLFQWVEGIQIETDKSPDTKNN